MILPGTAGPARGPDVPRHIAPAPAPVTAPMTKVFAEIVTDQIRQKAFLRAGLAKRTTVMDANGNPGQAVGVCADGDV